ncbi:MAG: hypothetical protein KKH98_12490 [Spirochaetes bacterium]|nr:hypothetical protein [Spirochaetota bacterium]
MKVMLISKRTLIIFAILMITGCSQRNPLFNLLDEQSDPSGNDLPQARILLAYAPEEYWIKEVIEYNPAPGQHVNNVQYNDPNNLLGPPRPGEDDVISLGSGGGYVVVRFDPPILDHPDNKGGFDFIIFGNAFYVAGPGNMRWQEPATVEVMKDENGNSIPDPGETWYLLKGSDTATGNTLSVTYDRTNMNFKPITKSHYPDTLYFPGYPDQVTFNLFFFPPSKTGQSAENIIGYADVTPTMENPGADDLEFYTVPDTPGDYPVDTGSGGGDAFKLEWAVDKTTGASVSLDSIDFIRIVNTATNSSGVLNEISAEIDAVSRVRRNNP